MMIVFLEAIYNGASSFSPFKGVNVWCRLFALDGVLVVSLSFYFETNGVLLELRPVFIYSTSLLLLLFS